MFGGLGLQGQIDGSSVSNIFEGLSNEEGKGAGKLAIFEGGLKFAASEARKNFDSTSSADRGLIGERLGSTFLVIGELAIERSLAIYEK